MHGWLTAILNLLGLGAGTPAVAPPAPGGFFRRALWSWPRVFARDRRTWARTWRYTVAQLPPQTLTKTVSDDRDFLFDFSPAAEIARSGLTISSATVEGGTGLTLGTPTVLAATTDGIAAGQGVSLEISGGTAGTTYDLAVVATLTNSRVLTIPARLVVTADHD